MAKVRIIACDGQHPEGLVPAVGRVGVQRDDVPVVWKDYCEACLAQVTGTLAAGGSMASVPLMQKGKTKMLRGEALEAMRSKLRVILHDGPMTGREIQEYLKLTRPQMVNVLAGMPDVKREGWSKSARFLLRGSGPKKAKVRHAA